MPIEFARTEIPTVSYGTNPYNDAVKTILDGSEAITFLHTVTNNGTRKDFDKIKRELQTAGNMNDVTVRSHVYDNATGGKLVLPSEKKATLRVVGSDADPHKAKVLKVVFWVTDRIVRGESDDDSEDVAGDDTEE